eukprot:Phypoly_transcript_05297.p1 GENE.Phypoly_transcript_05297~~Phypoly_transcript_05297.p1  ORF type:complete len:578 (+),score=90.96 Phypoly_transcript_05297:60-1736(+)
MSEKRELSGGDVFGYNKRPRTNNDSSFGDGSPGLSKVLHVRNVSAEASHEELVAFVSQFGSIVAIRFLAPKYQQALVELGSPQEASAVVIHSKSNPVFIAGKEVYFEYSKSQSINTSATSKSSNPASIHHILLCTILNPIYNITVDVIHAIMSPYGNVLRIVVFNKNGVQSLVEFQDANSAVQAYTALDGKDIYAGSCTLKIEFSRAEKLNIHTNDDKSRDYTNPHLSSSGPPTSHQPPPPPTSSYPPPHSSYSGYPYYPPPGAPQPPPPSYYGAPHGSSYGAPHGSYDAPHSSHGPSHGSHGQGPVLIVYGLEEPLMNTDRMFNLFSIYGNVHKIKIITHKKGSALVHMETVDMADRAQNSLNGITAFGQQLQIKFSKHQYIAESRNDIEQSSSGTNQYTKDFTTSALNRFRNNPNAAKNVYRPSMTLYFANAPREYSTLQDFVQLFTSLNAPLPKEVKFFSPPPTGPGAADERKIGLLEWSDLVGAVEALILGNNHKIGNHTLRLSFTANSIHGRGGGGGGGGGRRESSSGPSSHSSGPPPGTTTSSPGGPIVIYK